MTFWQWFTRVPEPIIPPASPPPVLPQSSPAVLIRAVCDQLWFDHRIPNGKQAIAMMTAIGWQESRFSVRDQIVTGKPAGQVGPATGFWQFERGGGVRGVMEHPSTAKIARAAVDAAGLPWDRDAIWRSFATPAGDRLAATFARLLLFSDPRALPPATPDAEEEAWACYVRNWRPGKPHRSTWGDAWRRGIG